MSCYIYIVISSRSSALLKESDQTLPWRCIDACRCAVCAMRAAAALASLAALSLLLVVEAIRGVDHTAEPFVGWKGESYQDPKRNGTAHKWIETISWSPRAFIYHNFLSPDEVEHMLSLVEKKVNPSSVIDTKTGATKQDPIRTSYGAAIERGKDEVIAAIEARIADWTRLPADHGEPIQVLRYQDGQKYDAHWDWFDDPTHPANSSEDNRVATVLMYLGDVEEGGETALPLGRFINEELQRPKSASECAQHGSGLAVLPNKGDALLFWDMHVDGRTVDRAALHASCPTLRGTKWTATKWIHNTPYGMGYDPLEIAAACKDRRDDCKALAAAGKCDSDPQLMLGLRGGCRHTCDDCAPCENGDLLCMRRNMRSQRAVRQAGSGAAAV